MTQEQRENADALRKLPVRAIVAIAVRHAERMRPSFDLPGNTPERGAHMAAVSAAIQLAKRFVEGQDIPENILELANKASAAQAATPENMFGIAAGKAGGAAALVYDALHGEKDLIPVRAAHVIPGIQFIGGTEAETDYQKLLALNLSGFPELGPALICPRAARLARAYSVHRHEASRSLSQLCR